MRRRLQDYHGRRRALVLMVMHGAATADGVARVLGVSEGCGRMRLMRLRRDGLAEASEEPMPGGQGGHPYLYYTPTQKGRQRAAYLVRKYPELLKGMPKPR